ncbi:MAG: PQQ-dependent sugar dehydrogenase [Pyrinomonadaceae bacterium]
MFKYKEIIAVVLILPCVALTTFCQSRAAKSDENTGKMPQIVNFDATEKYNIKPSDLPPPYATESANHSSRVIPQPANAALKVPPGFKVNIFAEGDFRNPRWLTLAPNGDVFVSDAGANKIIILRDTNGDGVADQRFTFAENLSQPFGIAFNGDYFYVANTDSVVRFKYKSGQTKAEGEPEKLITLTRGGYNQHWTRNIIFSPDGQKLYVSIGSSGNVGIETDERRAAISEYNPDGSGYRLYASGIRNPIGLAWNPVTKQLWTAANERDGLGDNLVPDFVTSVKDGAFYGFPYYYIGMNKDPRRPEEIKLKEPPTIPEVLVQAHSAALGLVFYNGKMFPDEYTGDALVALHGSWNRENLTGYKIIRIKMKDGKPVGGYEDFLTGWLPNENSREVWGRPVGLLVNFDGSLLICDDGANKIWRVSYQK